MHGCWFPESGVGVTLYFFLVKFFAGQVQPAQKGFPSIADFNKLFGKAPQCFIHPPQLRSVISLCTSSVMLCMFTDDDSGFFYSRSHLSDPLSSAGAQTKDCWAGRDHFQDAAAPGCIERQRRRSGWVHHCSCAARLLGTIWGLLREIWQWWHF